jgi:hypothetical protein
MPKEIIKSSDEFGGPPPEVHVIWGHDTFVNVATTPGEGIPFWWQVLASAESDEQTEKRLGVLGELVREVVDQHAKIDHGNVGRPESPAAEVGRDLLNALDVKYGPMDGMHVSLDRRRINDLIRQLRRARNAAYGQDE